MISGVVLDELESVFNILSKKFPDYENRPQQIEMASEVFRCLKNKKNLIEDVKDFLRLYLCWLSPKGFKMII